MDGGMTQKTDKWVISDIMLFHPHNFCIIPITKWRICAVFWKQKSG